MKTPYLSTSFTENGEKAKNRFSNILNTKTKKFGVVFILIAVVGIILTSFLLGNTGLTNEKLYNQMSLSKDEVFSSLNLNENSVYIQTDGDYANYTFDDEINNQECEIALIFYKDYMLGYQISFDNASYSDEFLEIMKNEIINDLGEDFEYASSNSGMIESYNWKIEDTELINKFSFDTDNFVTKSLSSTSFENLDAKILIVRYSNT